MEYIAEKLIFTKQSISEMKAKSKEFYIQILNPDNNVVSDQGNTVFDNKSLIYTKKIKVNYQKEDLNVSTFIETTKEEPIKNGVYFVNVFNNQNRVATTSITLK